MKVTTSLALEVIALVWYWSALLWHFAIGSHRIAFGSSEVIALLRTLLSDVIVLLVTVPDSTSGSFRKFSTCFGKGLNARTAKRFWPQRFPPRSRRESRPAICGGPGSEVPLFICGCLFAAGSLWILVREIYFVTYYILTSQVKNWEGEES